MVAEEPELDRAESPPPVGAEEAHSAEEDRRAHARIRVLAAGRARNSEGCAGGRRDGGKPVHGCSCGVAARRASSAQVLRNCLMAARWGFFHLSRFSGGRRHSISARSASPMQSLRTTKLYSRCSTIQSVNLCSPSPAKRKQVMSFADFPEPRGMAVNPRSFFRIAPKDRRGEENELSRWPKWFLSSWLSSVMPT